MCVICHKPAGIALPSDETIEKMFNHNPHGAGFAIQEVDKNGKCSIEYWKGFMNVKDFKEAIHSHGDLTNKRVVMHFRIKTHGETDQFTTHPFKMSNNYSDLRKLHGVGSVLFHNGVFTGLGGKADPSSSDTQDFVIGVAMHHLRQARQPRKVGLAVAQQIIGTCRVMILYPNADYQYIKFGSWTKHTDGCEYSNMSWNVTYTTSSSYSGNYHYSNHYKSLQSSTLKEDKFHKFDAFGCNIAEYAWPDKDTKWLNAGTPERFKTIMHAATVIDKDENGYQICKFNSTGEVKWYAHEQSLDIIREEMFEKMTEKYSVQSDLMQWGADLDDEIIPFCDEEEMLDFAEKSKRISDYVYKFGGKTWYLDTIELTAYTEKGIKTSFKTGEQGHVKRYLEEYGCTDKYLASGTTNPYKHIMEGSIVDQDNDDPFYDDYDDYLDSLGDDELTRLADEAAEEVDRAYGLA